jgi:hypothetical protein
LNTQLWNINHPLAHQVGWGLLHSLWQGALIGLAFVVARVALRGRSAHARYLAGCLYLTLLLVAPVLTAVLGSGGAAASDAGGVDPSRSAAAGAPALGGGGFGDTFAGAGAVAVPEWGTGFLGQATALIVLGVLLDLVGLRLLTGGAGRRETHQVAG